MDNLNVSNIRIRRLEMALQKIALEAERRGIATLSDWAYKALRETEPSWNIRVCRCGFPLGASLAAERLGNCPDCGISVLKDSGNIISVDVKGVKIMPS